MFPCCGIFVPVKALDTLWGDSTWQYYMTKYSVPSNRSMLLYVKYKHTGSRTLMETRVVMERFSTEDTSTCGSSAKCNRRAEWSRTAREAQVRFKILFFLLWNAYWDLWWITSNSICSTSIIWLQDTWTRLYGFGRWRWVNDDRNITCLGKLPNGTSDGPCKEKTMTQI